MRVGKPGRGHGGWYGIMVGLVLALSAGCGGSSGLSTYPVSGTLTLDGQPVEGADVVFLPRESSESQIACQALTDQEGRYEVSTHIGQGNYQPGMQAGVYGVEVSKLGPITNMDRPPPNLLPARYASQGTSGLQLEVKPGSGQTLDIELTSQ